ncbi:50S ribosomal protein L21 [Spirochaeta thermophila DSM 6578]|uniref:Large ribosomal subunit protein bL21 n=1 Tax=Winmispira thermophila (strain ATCC 700085 / DSM 6578 / Z-1203) TaxID=869211 RepID=G0GDH6_WINT7|nr:50S ribosomal protein L21 [Spirochaeta thermophila]AEJ61323.1 50S ribosomal protein L21 [Spirochaeta thermophila DSM 6578]
MYAVVEIGGKQYKAEEGKFLKVERLHADEGQPVDIDTVLMVRDDAGIKVGAPYVTGAKVKAVVSGHGKDRKVIVFKYKRRKNYRRKQGHRQQYTLLKVEQIQA